MALVALGACEYQYDIDPAKIVPAPGHTGEALRVIFKTYAMDGEGLPPVTWYRPDVDGKCPGRFEDASDGACVAGLENSAEPLLGYSGHIIVLRYDSDIAFSWNLLAHEIAHWRYGYDDDGHPPAVFGSYATTGVDGAIVGRADAALAAWESSAAWPATW